MPTSVLLVIGCGDTYPKPLSACRRRLIGRAGARLVRRIGDYDGYCSTVETYGGYQRRNGAVLARHPGDTALDSMAEVGSHFARLATALRDQDAESVDADRVVRFAVGATPHAEHGAVVLHREGEHLRTIAPTSAVPVAVGKLQYSTRQGPSLDALRVNEIVHSDDVSVDDRWPRFGPRCATSTGIRSMLAVRLDLGGCDRAALTLYSAAPSAFSSLELATASLFGPFTALSVQGTLRRTDTVNFQSALSSSRQIGTAVGILMALKGLSAAEAFDLLRQASNNLNRRLRDIAEEVELTGQVPVKPGAGEDPV